MRIRGNGAGDGSSAGSSSRRRVLATACTLGLTAMAGCHEDGFPSFGGHERDESGDLETAGTEQPEWSQWVDGDTDYFAVTDFGRIAEVNAYMSVLDTVGHSWGIINATALYPFTGVESVAESIPTLAAYSPMVFPAMDDELFVVFEDISLVTEDAPDSPIAVEQYIHVDDAIVLAGEMDRSGLAAHDTVDELDSYEDFTVYSVLGAYGDRWPIAANDSHLLFGVGETFEEDRQLIESAIDTAAGDAGLEADQQWLREVCDTGAFVVGANWEERLFLGEGRDNGLLVDIGVDTETLIGVIEFLTTSHVQHSLFVADGHDTGRVTRTGLSVADDAELPDEETVVEQLATDAESTNFLADENRLVLEAFWE